MWEFVKGKWYYFHSSFHGSDTLVWARAQLMLGAAYTAMQSMDMSLFISDRHALQYYIFANAMITELLRRRGEDWHDGDKK